MNPRKTIVVTIIVVLLLGIGFVFAQEQNKPQEKPTQHPMMMKSSKMKSKGMGCCSQTMMSNCQMMMNTGKKMKQKMKQLDTTLAELVRQMNQAHGNEKVEAMAAVINELVKQRKMMRQMMMTMQPRMMQHMMMHMAMGGMTGMMNCPMMKSMKKQAAPQPDTGEQPDQPPIKQ